MLHCGQGLFADDEGKLPEALEGSEGSMINSVCNEVITAEQSDAVQWSDIAGQQQAKQLIQEMVVWPSLYPNLCKVTLASVRCATLHLAQCNATITPAENVDLSVPVMTACIRTSASPAITSALSQTVIQCFSSASFVSTKTIKA